MHLQLYQYSIRTTAAKTGAQSDRRGHCILPVHVIDNYGWGDHSRAQY
jgi:hypothetical protein